MDLSPEQLQILKDAGLPAKSPHRSTILRRQAKAGKPFPVISRSGRGYTEKDGRQYGEVDPNLQMQADAGFWRVGAAVRSACEPMTIAVGGVVQRIREVESWSQHENGKWVAKFGRQLTDAQLDAEYPTYPYRHGDACPTRQGGAYRPETY